MCQVRRCGEVVADVLRSVGLGEPDGDARREQVAQFPIRTLLGKWPAARRRGLELQQAFRIAMRDLGHFFRVDRQGVQKGSPLGVRAEWVIHGE